MSAPLGNENALRVGLYVKGSNGLKLRDQRVRKLVQRVRAAMPWLEDTDAPVCRAWAEFEVLASRVYAELRDQGVINGEGEGRRLLDDYRKLRATQIILSREYSQFDNGSIMMACRKSGSGQSDHFDGRTPKVAPHT